ncbi:methylated-DNA--[protein]-cysteine S-methyltransferase [Streptomyces sp. NPDC059909]|uniref:methylated-DNA--[protein]-cysteine S-methyltransferase n=1 Tax=Streptomyces sp. NPDC059909 TaxID=3346998 RepID=UPI003655AE9E
MNSFEWTVVGSDIGPLLLAATGEGLVSVVFHADERVRDRALGRLAARLGAEPVEVAPGIGSDVAPGDRAEDGSGDGSRVPADPVLLAEPIRQLAEYFAGRRRDFELPLDWSLSSGFNREVLRELASGVPYGSVVGYGDLADRVGQPGAAQAVGTAMGSNPLPVVVPCHRVVESNGGLGGFGGGLETKRQLLALEGVLPQPLF